MNSARSIAWVIAILAVAFIILLVSQNQRSGLSSSSQMQQADKDRQEDSEPETASEQADEDPPEEPAAVRKARQKMVERQLADRDIENQRVLDAMSKVRRHLFVPEAQRDFAYEDYPLSIGNRQTISQPYIVALMTQLVEPKQEHKALDIGTGSGYQAAVLGELVDHVYSIEIIESLAIDAQKRLKRLGYKNITVRHGDGYKGWKEHAPFDIIIVAAAPDHIPEALIEQLAPNGRLVIPVGDEYQSLMLVEKDESGAVKQREIIPVRFVPMTGEAEKDR